jgi:hypothetical protein
MPLTMAPDVVDDERRRRVARCVARCSGAGCSASCPARAGRVADVDAGAWTNLDLLAIGIQLDDAERHLL